MEGTANAYTTDRETLDKWDRVVIVTGHKRQSNKLDMYINQL